MQHPSHNSSKDGNRSLAKDFEQLEQFISKARQLEAALDNERKRALKTEQELRGMVEERSQAIERENARAEQLTLDLAQARGEMVRSKIASDQSKRDAAVAESKLKQAMDQLKHYQAAWAAVLEREKIAKDLIAEGQRDKLVVEQLKSAYEKERERSRRAEAEAQSNRETYDRLLEETRAQVREYENQLSRYREAHHEQQKYEATLQERVRTLAEEHRTIREELQQYKSAWAQVLEREKEAKAILGEREDLLKKTTELNSQLLRAQNELSEAREIATQNERHAKRYQSELQHALVRIHSSESKFNELNQELQAVAKKKRSLDEDLQRMETTLRERLEWEYKKDRERFKAEVEKESALEREQFRQEVRDRLRLEYENKLQEERDRYERMKTRYEIRLAELSRPASADTPEPKARLAVVPPPFLKTPGLDQ